MSESNAIKKVALIGLGTMGAGIAEVFAKAGLDVVGIETNEEFLERGKGIIKKSTDRAVAKGRMDEAAQQEMMDRIRFTTDTADGVKDRDLVVEVVPEKLDLKLSIFKTLSDNAPADCILATNTSSLSITAIATAVENPERVMGVHFFNPAPVQTLVELIRTLHTDPAVVERMQDFVRSLKKSPIVCGDRAGFIVNSLLVPYLGSAIRFYENGWCTREELDQAMVQGAGYPMGPLTLTDLIGTDVCEDVLERMYEETKDRTKSSPELLHQLVTANLLGQKTGRGFYTYEKGKPTDAPGPVRKPKFPRLEELPDRLVANLLNEALKMVEVNYCSLDDIDTGMAEGCRMPKPFETLEKLGPKYVLHVQRKTYGETGEPAHRPSHLLVQLADEKDASAAIAHLREVTAKD